MNQTLFSAACMGVLANFSFGQTVFISPTAPTTDLVTSLDIGMIDTALFDEDANANHGRGQLFALPDNPGSSFGITAMRPQITSISVDGASPPNITLELLAAPNSTTSSKRLRISMTAFPLRLQTMS